MILHLIAAILSSTCVVGYGYRAGLLLASSYKVTVGEAFSRLGIFLIMAFVSAGLYVRYVSNDPFQWFHYGLLGSLVITNIGLVLFNRKGSDPR